VREWAVRCAHEATLHREGMFLTLTYGDEELPRTQGGLATLRPRDFVLFMKQLRRWIEPVRVRFFQAAEYSPAGRPHHHVLVYGYFFGDGYVFLRRKGGELYRSPTLERLWTFGFSSYGLLKPGAAFYTAQYAMKKSLGMSFAMGDRVPEYQTMSRRPGIGKNWFDKFQGDIYPRDDFRGPDGNRMRAPRYYDDLYEKGNPVGAADVKLRRKVLARERAWEDGPGALARSDNIKARARLSPRGLDGE